jgi:hypothetical protein
MAAPHLYFSSIFSTVTVLPFVVPLILANTTSTLPDVLGFAEGAGRAFSASAAFALPCSSNLKIF